MRRVLAYLGWKSGDWLQKGCPTAVSSLTSCPHRADGLRAYASRQAKVFSDIRNHFLGIWTGLELPREHLTEPVYPVDPNSDPMEVDGDDS